MRTFALGLLLAACGRDVQLGVAVDARPDSLIDAMPSPFTPGTYSLAFTPDGEVTCDGTLTGQETDFAMTAVSVGFVDGTVTLLGVNEVVIRLVGDPIASAFNRTMVDLTPNPEGRPPDLPQTIWDTAVNEDFGAGPAGTEQLGRYFGIDSATAASTALESASALYFETSDTMGACFVVFAATLTSQ